MKKQPFIWCTLFLVICLSLTLLAACGDNTATYAPAPDTKTDSGSSTSADEVAPTSLSGAPTKAAATTAAATTAAATTAAAATTSAAGAAGIVPAPIPVNQDPLKAGAVDDNLKFDEYLQYLRSYQGKAALPFDITERYIISVVDGNARTVSNGIVKIYDGQNLVFEGKTYSNGQILFFPRAISSARQATQFTVVAEKSGRNASKVFQRVDPGQGQNEAANLWTVQLNGSLRPQIEPAPNLDLLFLLDSTGSMGGEISKIQQTIRDIAAQISDLPGSPKVRFGVVTYRDRGDNYVTRKFGFTEDLGEFSKFLNSIAAGGGGDYPESLNEGLHVAIRDMNWNSADSVRLAFLVADAPPHLDYKEDFKYTNEIVEAMRRGIKIYSIGASGLDKQGEYVFRQLAQTTLAQYLFITRGGDENPQSSSTGPASNTNVVYEEKNLDRIVVNIVRRELTNLTQ